MKKMPLPMKHPSYVWSCMAYRSYAPFLCLPSIWLQSFASISGLLYNSLISLLSQFYFTFSIFYGFESFMYLLKLFVFTAQIFFMTEQETVLQQNFSNNDLSLFVYHYSNITFILSKYLFAGTPSS